MSQIAITHARIIDPASGFDGRADLLIDNGVISAWGEDIFKSGIPDEAEHIDAQGLILAPGLIDMRVITGEPGRESKETLASAGQAAAKGGVTSMVVMPQTRPIIDDIALVDYIQRRAEQTSPVRVYCAGALTQGLDNQAITEIGMMSEAGAVYFSNGETPIADSRLMRRLLSYSSTYNALIAHRPFDPAINAETCAHESDFSSRLGLSGAPSTSERIMIERDLALAELTGGRLLIDLISSAEGLDVIRRAKSKDLEIAASVSINHLALNELDIGDYRTFAKLDPPLREEHDRMALIKGINDGVIDVIVSSHDPRPAGEKRRPFAEAGAGAVGLEILLGAGMTLVADGQLDLMAFLAAVTANPAALLGLDSGVIAKGRPADLVLIDPGAPWVCDASQLLSKSKNTPFDTRRLQGRAVMTMVGGTIVFDER